MVKKKFNNPTQVTERKGVQLLIDEPPYTPKSEEKEEIKYSTYNVRVRQDFKEKLYNVKGRTGKSFADIFDMIFEDYFERNP